MGKSPRHKKSQNPRAIALDLLCTVTDAPIGTLNDRISAAVSGLEARDKGFVRALVAETLRRFGQINDIMGRCLNARKRPPERVAWILRLGICQLLFLEVSPHAAVNTSVALVGCGGALTGFVNGVLRRVGRDGPAWRDAQDAARCNTPDRLWGRWCSAYGSAAARKIAEAHLCPPPLDLTVISDPERWAGKLGGVVLPTGTVRITSGGDVTRLPGYGQGAWWVQDAAAALPAKILAPKPGDRVLDMCAAPGGKALQLAALGAEVTALDVSRKRLRVLAENFNRVGLACRSRVADCTHPVESEGEYDAILLDAPCSATGTLRRHPDLPLLKHNLPVTGLVQVQSMMLENAWRLLKPRGRLVYCTCSLDPAEGEERIATFLAKTAAAALDPVQPHEVGGLGELLTERGEIRSLPLHLAELNGIDGFYVARLVKLSGDMTFPGTP